MWNASHLAVRLCAMPQGQKPLAISQRKTPDSKMISWKGGISNLPNDFAW